MAYPYQITGSVTGSIESGSFFNQSDNELFYRAPTRDFWFGFSPFDATEIAVYDFDYNQLAWGVVDDNPTFTKVIYSYENEKNQIIEYDYNKFVGNFILYKNDKILEPTVDHLSELKIGNGDYIMTYNYVRYLAGNPKNLLSIKDISSSKKELKIIPTTSDSARFQAFCQKKFQIKDISSLIIQSTDGCPYDQIYRNVKDQYQSNISFLQSIFFLTSDGDVLNFLKNLYEDYVRYVTLSTENISDGISPDRIERTQGIKTYFQNWLRENNDNISNFDIIENKFVEYTNYRISQKFIPYASQKNDDYIGAKQFIYDFFVKYFYETTIDPLEESYYNKYGSYLKNVLNVGGNRFFPILIHDFVIENNEMVLLIKLAEELPSDIKIKDRCWISNFGMVPYTFQISVRGSISNKTVKISSPNFFLRGDGVSTKNINKLYTADDLKQETTTKTDAIEIQKKITELNIDYSSFENFIVFSSAQSRLNVFKNKIINWTTLSSSLSLLQSNSSSVYPYYTSEKTDIETQMSTVIDSFDGYESYLFNQGNFEYNLSSETWNSSSYITLLDSEAIGFDKNNSDSLINNTPDYIVLDEDNDEYLIFLSMVGHYFDNIYLYIKSLPIERVVQNQISGSMSGNMLKDMLGSFGWNIDDILGDGAQDNVYLDSVDGGVNVMSDLDRTRNIWNRILVTLPQLYKTKGTEECVRLMLSCHGIPTDLISVKEYGGIDYSAGSKVSYIQNEKIYMLRYKAGLNSGNSILHVQWPDEVKTLEFKVGVLDETNYVRGGKYPLIYNYVSIGNRSPQAAHLGWWNISIERGFGKYDGKIIFEIIESSSVAKSNPGAPAIISSSYLPIFNGDVFSVMLRRNWPDSIFSTSSVSENSIPTKYDLYVQKNDQGRVVFKSTSSVILTEKYNNAWSMWSETPQSSSYLIIGNGSGPYYSGSYIHNSFEGVIDKILIWRPAVSDSDFEDHVNDWNSYSWSGSTDDEPLYKNLYFNSSVDYPIDISTPSFMSGSDSGSFGISSYTNKNEYYRAPINWVTTASVITSSVETISWIPTRYSVFRTGSSPITWGFPWYEVSHSLSSDSCSYITHSAYPYQYVEYNTNQVYTIGTYGPNKFKNNKIKKYEQTLDVRLDDLYSSTNPLEQLISPDSNIFGFFIDPQDSKNKDIVRYFGNSGLLDSISDPLSLYSSSYTSLSNLRNRYAKSGDKKVLFNELISLNKFYFDKSIFNIIKNVAPARANTLTGVLIEPSIIERSKYQYQPLSSDVVNDTTLLGEINNIQELTSELLWSEFNTDVSTSSIPKEYPNYYYTYVSNKNQNLSLPEPIWYTSLKNNGEIVLYNGFEYLIDDYKKILYNLSMPANYQDTIDISNISNPNTDYPINYGGNYIGDFPDKFQFGWFPDLSGEYRNDEVISNGVYPLGAVGCKDEYTCRSGSVTYYLLKRWRKHNIYSKTGPHIHDDNPRNDEYSTSSIYLYDIIHVSEDFYKKYVYMSDNDSREIIDPSTNFESGYGYHHQPSTFVSTSNDIRSNIKTSLVAGGSETDIEYWEDISDNGYYELLLGYPRNHYTHKMQLLSPSRFPIFDTSGTGSVFIKGRQTINTTIGTGSLGDNSLPITSNNVSDVNVVRTDNVLN